MDLEHNPFVNIILLIFSIISYLLPTAVVIAFLVWLFS